MKNKIFDAFLIGVLACMILYGISFCCKISDRHVTYAYADTTTQIIPNTEDNFCYVICDVLNSHDCNGNQELYCLMQDGSVQIYELEDAPEGKVAEVTFKATDLDDFDSYEIVAVKEVEPEYIYQALTTTEVVYGECINDNGDGKTLYDSIYGEGANISYSNVDGIEKNDRVITVMTLDEQGEVFDRQDTIVND